ncbi:MAG: hypothetical protein GJ677_00865 [Rhodobacteraceae bacterium]|nr:hypothetical protein [Paracoccaceae bacterium]
MSNNQNAQIIASARDFSRSRISAARSDQAQRLEMVDEACQSIINEGVKISVTTVRRWIITHYGLAISGQNFSNSTLDQDTGSRRYRPYRQIVDKYREAQNAMTKRKRINNEAPILNLPSLSRAELSAISDDQVRYKVQLILGRIRSLHQQCNSLREISKLPVLSVSQMGDQNVSIGGHSGEKPEPNRVNWLNEEELRALSDFVDARALKTRRLEFDEFGALIVFHPASNRRHAASVSKPNLESALHRLLKLHGK